MTEAPWLMFRDGYYYLFYSRYCTVLYCTVLYCTVLYYYLCFSSAWFFEDKYHVRVAKAWDYILWNLLDTFITLQEE